MTLPQGFGSRRDDFKPRKKEIRIPITPRQLIMILYVVSIISLVYSTNSIKWDGEVLEYEWNYMFLCAISIVTTAIGTIYMIGTYVIPRLPRVRFK